MTPEERIKAYLFQNRSSIQSETSIDAVVARVKQLVFFGIAPISDGQIRQVVTTWAMINAVGLLTTIGAGKTPNPSDPSPASSDFVDSVKKAIGTIGAGVTIGKDGANLNLKVTGLTANLKTADGSASLGVSWGGKLKLEAESGPFHFSGEIASDKWKFR